MSTHFTACCDTCGVYGPDIRRQAGGVILMPADWGEPGDRDERTQDEWARFLIVHESHDLRLRSGP